MSRKAHEGMAAMAARAIWKGSISFGLVNIPIQVFSTTQKEEYSSFNQLCDKGHKINLGSLGSVNAINTY
jgi:non-homologous end joining protein Ku